MKNISIYLFAIALGLVCSCRKQDNSPQEPEFEEKYTAIKNGQPWSGTSLAEINQARSRYSIVCDSLGEFGVGTEALLLSKIPFSKGTFQLRKNTGQHDLSQVSASFFTHNGDSYSGFYDVMESDSLHNFITIHSVDTVSNRIKGVFNVTFIIRIRTEDVPGNPDTIRFTQGLFNTKFLNP